MYTRSLRIELSFHWSYCFCCFGASGLPCAARMASWLSHLFCPATQVEMQVSIPKLNH